MDNGQWIAVRESRGRPLRSSEPPDSPHPPHPPHPPPISRLTSPQIVSIMRGGARHTYEFYGLSITSLYAGEKPEPVSEFKVMTVLSASTA